MPKIKEKIYNNEFYDALLEINIILEYMGITSIFPDKFMEFLKENKNNNHYFKYDESVSLNEQNITPTAKQILAILYSEYFCTTEQKEELEKIWKENDKISLGQTSLNDNEEVNKNNNSMIKYSDSFFKKILRKIKELFKG